MWTTVCNDFAVIAVRGARFMVTRIVPPEAVEDILFG
jgi:hypothetical protein